MTVLNTDGGERKKGVEKSVLNTVLNTVRIVKSFSVPPDHIPSLEAFIDISRREDPDFSTTVRKAIREYVQRHSIPNPQARLDRMFKLGLPHKPSWQCCVPNCENKASYKLFLKDYEGKTETFQVCRQHRRWKHKRYRFIKAYQPLTQ